MKAKMMKKQLRIMVDDATQSFDLAISFDDPDIDKVGQMTLQTVYQGQEIVAVGTYYPFQDAFADLQNKLPQNVQLICCAACRYGNLCPVGDAPDEVYCTKDVPIACKTDLFHYTEDADEVKKRRRQYADCCGDFRPQEEGFFTYSDYLEFLNKNRLTQ